MQAVSGSVSNLVIASVLLTAIGKHPCRGGSEICESNGFFDQILGHWDIFGERCTNQWIKNDMHSLKNELDSKLFGQHLATRMIVTSIRGHLETRSPPKALTISFHGSTGIGKTYVSEMIARSLYRNGLQSKFVRRFYGQTDFPDNRMVHEYQNRVRREIEECVTSCCQCFFIFDEIDKMPPGIFDMVKAYFDHFSSVHGLNYRKSIFLFISNTGSQKLVEFMLSRWESGLRRESLEINEVEPYLRQAVYNTEGGLKHSALIKHNLLGTFIPFMPLERKHVEECIKALSQYRHFGERVLTKVTESLSWYPEDTKIFATTGCTSVLEKLHQHDEF